MARSSGGANRKLPNVRFGSKADMCIAKRHVRFVPKADISVPPPEPIIPKLLRGLKWGI